MMSLPIRICSMGFLLSTNTSWAPSKKAFNFVSCRPAPNSRGGESAGSFLSSSSSDGDCVFPHLS